MIYLMKHAVFTQLGDNTGLLHVATSYHIVMDPLMLCGNTSLEMYWRGEHCSRLLFLQF